MIPVNTIQPIKMLHNVNQVFKIYYSKKPNNSPVIAKIKNPIQKLTYAFGEYKDYHKIAIYNVFNDQLFYFTNIEGDFSVKTRGWHVMLFVSVDTKLVKYP